jgi:hypothetical protein
MFYYRSITLWLGLVEEKEESYEDSDQTPLYGKEATVLGYQWTGGIDRMYGLSRPLAPQ